MKGYPLRFDRILFVATLCLILLKTSNAQQLVWQPQGAAPTTRGQVEGIENREVAGAIQAVALHPTDANTAYIGAVNGGIWRTDDIMKPVPTWFNQTDLHQSLSIGALEFDPSDANSLTLVAGLGRFSSFYLRGGNLNGILRTTDGGVHWNPIAGNKNELLGLNISGVAPRGKTIVVSVNKPVGRSGIWRTEDHGKSWNRISGSQESGLPNGPAWDLVGVRTNSSRLYTNAGNQGVYRSDNTGKTWNLVSDSQMNEVIKESENIQIATGSSNIVYVGIVKQGRLKNVFRSANSGGGWSMMPTPVTQEKLLHGIHPGRQGKLHFSIAADPSNNNIVYVGGDRQPHHDDGVPNANIVFPNSLGARNFTGRLFRGDASKPKGQVWAPLTHKGTSNNSAPHADSRDMDVANNGQLVEVNDGGIYRRTKPLSETGQWYSSNGDLHVTEFHAVAWDAVSKKVIGGSQDTGSSEQMAPSGHRYRSVSEGDGAVVAIADGESQKFSTRYSSSQWLQSFTRRTFDHQNILQSEDYPNLKFGQVAMIGRDKAQFYTPLQINAADSDRLVFGMELGVFESFDRGDTLSRVLPEGLVVNSQGHDPIAYGAKDNPDILYVGVNDSVYIRSDSPKLSRSDSYPGDVVRGIALDFNNGNTAYVIDSDQIFTTRDAGESWNELTDDLNLERVQSLRSIAFDARDDGRIFIGSDRGVQSATGPEFNDWRNLGENLPMCSVFHLEFDKTDNVLLAGTLGRGAWIVDLSSLPR